MANHSKNNPIKVQRNISVAQSKLAGKSYREIAKIHGIDPGTVSRILQNADIKDIIETGTKQIVAMVPKAIDNYREFLVDEDKKIKLSATQDVAKMTGLSPSHTQNVIISNSFNNNQQVLSPEVLELLRLAGEPVVDIDLEFDAETVEKETPEDAPGGRFDSRIWGNLSK